MAKMRMEVIIHEASRRALIEAVRAHPEWTLLELCEYVSTRATGAKTLGSVTIHELVEVGDDSPELDDGPPIDRGRREQAKRATGESFDVLVRAVLAEARAPVGAKYLRARLGGPHWKLAAALRRLTEAGVAERRGVTRGTVYVALEGC